MNYKEALKELESILEQLRSGDIEIDELASHTERASELIEWCRTRLRTVEGQLDHIVNKEEGEVS